MYQVLARKWRPKNFQELVGQEHISQALSYGLDHNRLHHAYLFTGTRGVGKTTIARIFAKSINCLNNGVSSQPCGECNHCREIDGGNFPDLIEIDAASRTGVDDTREILNNVPYAPVKGRFKVYLIDEVHMFSRSSFNALLKTLEEPPEHVKFILATTDPQKLPVTIISRCLQFHLKNMAPSQIVAHLQRILETERIPHEREALLLLAEGANGSMRDALSLLDQAIICGQGAVKTAATAQLLGSIPGQQLLQLLLCLARQEGTQLRQLLHDLDSYAPDYSQLVHRLLQLLQTLTVIQLNAQRPEEEFPPLLLELAPQLPVELVQLWYQILTDTWQSLPYQPELRLAVEMGLLRMMALRPLLPQSEVERLRPIREAEEIKLSREPALPESEPPELASPGPAANGAEIAGAVVEETAANAEPPPAAAESDGEEPPPWAVEEVPATEFSREEAAPAAPVVASPPDYGPYINNVAGWAQFIDGLALPDKVRALADSSCPLAWEANILTLGLGEFLCGYFADQAPLLAEILHCEIKLQPADLDTPQSWRERQQLQQQKDGEQAFLQHCSVRLAMELLDGQVENIQPLN